MEPHAPHILIVDDNPEILEVVSLMLKRQGLQISTRTRMIDFTSEVTVLSPDLIIIDQHLGWADGCALCAMLKANKNLQHLPVIMFSAYHKMKEQCLFCGADAFLAKPFDMHALLGMIRSLTGKPVT